MPSFTFLELVCFILRLKSKVSSHSPQKSLSQIPFSPETLLCERMRLGWGGGGGLAYENPSGFCPRSELLPTPHLCSKPYSRRFLVFPCSSIKASLFKACTLELLPSGADGNKWVSLLSCLWSCPSGSRRSRPLQEPPPDLPVLSALKIPYRSVLCMSEIPCS